MIKLVILNQRGGVGKTTSAITIARFFADSGKKTLLVDADPQGSINTILRLKPTNFFYDFAIRQFSLDDCIVSSAKHLHILCGNRTTADAEKTMMTEMARERLFENFFGPYDDRYEAVVIDVGPSVSLMQTCAMVYAGKVLIPVDTDYVSVSGAAACLQFCETLAKAVRIPVQPLAILPTMVDRRLGLTKVIRGLLEELSERFEAPILHEIRTDAAVGKATRAHSFLVDFDPKTKAMEDYTIAGQQLLDLLEGKKLKTDAETTEQAQTAQQATT